MECSSKDNYQGSLGLLCQSCPGVLDLSEAFIDIAPRKYFRHAQFWYSDLLTPGTKDPEDT